MTVPSDVPPTPPPDDPDPPDDLDSPDSPDPPDPPEWREVVLSGGGTGGLAMLGALQWLYVHGHLRHVTRWVTASVGALLATLCLAGYTPSTTYAVLSAMPFAEMADDFTADCILGFFDAMGAMEPTRVIRLLRVMLAKRGYVDVTLAAFAERTGTELVVTGYSVTRGETVAFDARSHPTMPLVTACRISMSAPLLFRPVVYEGEMYVDGATTEHVPVRFAKYKRRSLVVHCFKEHPERWPVATNLMELATQLHGQSFRCLEDTCMARVHRKRPRTVLTVTVPRSGAYVVDYGLDAAGKAALYAVGWAGAEGGWWGG